MTAADLGKGVARGSIPGAGSVTVLGVRHHGPGSARAVRAGLAALAPDIVLIEGPPEASSVLEHVAGLIPPVAILAHASDRPGSAAFWPFADFSPEWQAVRFAAEAAVPVRFVDLPAAAVLADGAEANAEHRPGRPSGPGLISADPLGWLSNAAGHDDPERWWEDVVEHRLGGDPLELFAAVAEAMAALRSAAEADGWLPSRYDLCREAAMRQGIRAAGREGHARIAVVCGAWHAPVLATLPPARGDVQLLRGLPKAKARVTWVPWTSQRLTYASGYGAGVASPGWYAHLWRSPDHIAERWVARVAALLRAADLAASPASAVETVRLAEAVAALRGRSLPGLSELTDAVLTVLCHGDEVPLSLIHRKLVVGDELGVVPADVPTVPLQADFEATCRRLRFRPAAEDRHVELDLRRDTDRERSRLLHRLSLLGIGWGTIVSAPSAGTFREGWLLAWRPEFVVALIENARYGTTIVAAATAVAAEQAEQTAEFAQITELVEAAVLADLPDALPAVTAALERRSARTDDIAHLMAATPPLARVLRYGSVRQTDTDLLRGVLDSILIRIRAGLASACMSLDAQAASAMQSGIEDADGAIALVGTDEQASAWREAQHAVAQLEGAAPVLRGRCVRMLLDSGSLTSGQAQQQLARALSAGPESVAWLEGFLRGSGTLLLRDQPLWDLLDDWLSKLSAEAFDGVLPLLRRSFAQFTGPERKQMGMKVRAQGRPAAQPPAGPEPDDDWDESRVRRVLEVVAIALGGSVTDD